MTQLFNAGILLNLKRLIKKLPIVFTKNQQYDTETKQIIQKVCKANSNTIDVGTHEGAILDMLIQQSPGGFHFGFEPIPDLQKRLKAKYAGNEHVKLFELALTDTSGETAFNYVLSNPSYSGIKKRKYDRKNETDTTITVKTNTLDAVILPLNQTIDFIKIDVEGGEMAVLKGAEELIKRDQPVIVFECGIGGTDMYNTTPAHLFEFFMQLGYGISLMKDFLQVKTPFTKQAFEEQYYQKLNYYFVASPQRKM
ncbi:MAG: FkbM family methyltransferase [Lacibacter sp.]